MRRFFIRPALSSSFYTARASCSSRASNANRPVRLWLWCGAASVAAVVVVGGITRLTESGLSIVEWKPISGVRPPLTDSEWEEEFERYKKYPEFLQKPDMTLREFQFIFFWEWSHRVLARSLGLIYGVPLIYFLSKGRFNGNAAFAAGLTGILGLGALQGAMGWFMVRSGLDMSLLDERKKATVSAYRLASHLCLAFVIFSCMLRMSFGLQFARCAHFEGFPVVQMWSRMAFTSMFVTAMSGAFVAGLDAGLLYNEGFPLMCGGIFPPKDHLWTIEPMWRNIFENPSTAQTLHRLLAGATTITVVGLNRALLTRRAQVPYEALRTLRYVNGLLCIQVALGMLSIVSYVHVHTAASHQVGALALLTSLIRMCAVFGSRGTILV